MSNNKRNTSRNYASTKKQPNAEQTETPVEEPVVAAESEEVEAPVPCKHFARVTGVKAGLRLRNRPSTESDVLSILKPNQDGIEILENLGKWTKVQVGLTIGYVMTEFIEEE